MKTATAFAVLAMTAFGHGAKAADWYVSKIGSKGSEDAVIFFDGASIERGSGAITLSFKVFKLDLRAGVVKESLVTREKMNCQNMTTQTLAITAYDAEDKLQFSDSQPTSELPVISGSAGETMLKMVCASDFPAAAASTHLHMGQVEVGALVRDLALSRAKKYDSAPR